MNRRAVFAAAALAVALVPLAAQSAEDRGPALWRVSDEDSDLYLFGTFHLLPQGTDFETSALTAAMRATPTTIFEVDTQSESAVREVGALVQRYGFNPEGVTLQSLIGQDRFDALAARAASAGVAPAQLEPLRPWLAILTVSLAYIQQFGFDAASGAEAAIRARAAAEGDALAYLESAEVQIKALAALDGEDMLETFDAQLKQIDEIETAAGELLAAWLAGDLAALERFALDDLRDTPGAYNALIVARNEAWIAEIERLMTGEGDAFIAVGAGHLVGRDGVVRQLKKKGYRVERVQ